MLEIVSAFGLGKFVEDSSAEIPELIDGPFRSVAEQLLQFGKRQLNRIQIGRVRRQVSKFGADCFDRFADAGYLVTGEIVHHHDVAWLQCRSQMLLDPTTEQRAVDGPVDRERSDEASARRTLRKVVVSQRPQGVFSINRVPTGVRP